MAEHTPGPWQALGPTERPMGGVWGKCYEVWASEGWAASGTAGRRVVAEIGCWGDRPDPEADARLIAAAPILRGALERLLELDGQCDYRDGDYPDPATCPGIAENGIRCHWCEGWAALAMARGEAAAPPGEAAPREESCE